MSRQESLCNCVWFFAGIRNKNSIFVARIQKTSWSNLRTDVFFRYGLSVIFRRSRWRFRYYLCLRKYIFQRLVSFSKVDLDFFNFGDHVSENFLKSVVTGFTMRAFIGSYISSAIYDWLGIPLNEFWFRFFYLKFHIILSNYFFLYPF